MKKFLVVIFALTVAVGVFAADPVPALSFGMYTDITATIAKADSYDIYNETYLSYKNKDMGFNATVVAKADFFAAPRNYAIWYQWCNGFKIYAGKLREAGSARLTSYIDGNGFSTRLANVQEGVMVYWDAVKDLTVAWFTPITGQGPWSSFRASSLGLSYKLPNLGTIVAAYRSSVNPGPGSAPNEASFGVDLKVVKDTTLKFGYRNTEGAIWPVSKFLGPNNFLYFTYGKVAGDLNLGVDVNFQLTGAALGFKPIYGLEGMVEYTMGDYVLGVLASVDNGDAWYGYNGFFINPYIKKSFSVGALYAGLTYDATTASFTMPLDFELSY